MASGKHRKRRSWFWMWFLAALAVLWGGIWASGVLSSHYVALQRPSRNIARPVHIVRPRASQPLTKPTTANVITVSQNETLWSIAHQYCGDGNEYRKIAAENGIKGWVIQPGQKVKVEC